MPMLQTIIERISRVLKMMGTRSEVTYSSNVISGTFFNYDGSHVHRASGPTARTERKLKNPFKRIVSNGPINVLLTPGKETRCMVEAQSSIHPMIHTDVEDGELKIWVKGSFSTTEPIQVHLVVSDFEHVELKGSGKIKTTEKFDYRGNLKVVHQGSGTINLEIMSARVSASLRGSGKIKLKGQGEFLDAELAGSGDFQAREFEVQDAIASISGSGDMKVNSTKSLVASIWGSGTIGYAGNPPKVTRKVKGVGDIDPL